MHWSDHKTAAYPGKVGKHMKNTCVLSYPIRKIVAAIHYTTVTIVKQAMLMI